jgi:DNA-binding winged helix-turn-helix (wHTH) protein
MRVVLGSSAVAGKRPFCDRRIAASGSRFRRARPAFSHPTLGSKQGKVISERWDFYGRLVLALAAEKMMLDRALTFGRYRLEPQGGLMSGAREIRLTPKALALLTFLAERPGKVISKEELFVAVWPGVAVGDAALVTCIQELRKALRDNARHPRYIETLHRRGYRFIAEIASAPPEAALAPDAPALPLPDRPSIAVLITPVGPSRLMSMTPGRTSRSVIGR